LHLVDVCHEDVTDAYHTIRDELIAYHPELALKPEVVALSKCDAVSEDILHARQQELVAASGQDVFVLSSASGQGVDAVLQALWQKVEAYRSEFSQIETEKPEAPSEGM
jgi:GTPase